MAARVSEALRFAGLHRFRPALAATVAVALALPILLGLGIWQVKRGQEKAQLLAEASAAADMAPLDLARITRIDGVAGQRLVRVQGEFLVDQQGLLDNQVRDGQIGYDILTPLRAKGVPGVLLVNRGWLARGGLRSDVPEWQTPQGTVALTGYLHQPADIPFVSGEVTESFGGLWVVSEISTPLLGQYLGLPVQARVLRLAPDSEHGFRRDWPVVAMTPQRHYGYAVQWFGLAGALLWMYVLAGMRRARRLTAPQEK